MQAAQDDYRCELTIDIEEIIEMSNNEMNTKFTVTAVYNSGREETFSGGLNRGGALPKAAQTKITQLKNFPTVKSVKVDLFI